MTKHTMVTVEIGGKLYTKAVYKTFVGDYVRHNGNRYYIRLLRA